MITVGGYLILATQVVVLLTAVFGAWKATRSEDASKKNAEALQRLEIHVDGRLSQLLELSKSSSRAEGVIEGRASHAPPAISNGDPAKVELVKAIPIKIEK